MLYTIDLLTFKKIISKRLKIIEKLFDFVVLFIYLYVFLFEHILNLLT